MRKKGKKVIRPAGDELMDYLNRGFAIGPYPYCKPSCRMFDD